jgi:hypothetical protein
MKERLLFVIEPDVKIALHKYREAHISQMGYAQDARIISLLINSLLKESLTKMGYYTTPVEQGKPVSTTQK